MGFKICSYLINRIKFIYQKIFVKRLKVGFIGLEESGKSTMVYALFENKYREDIGSSEVRVSKHIIDNVEITIYDIPGNQTSQSKWDHYFKKVDVLVFFQSLIDSPEKIERSREALHGLLYRNMWMKKSLLILGTKNDLPEAIGCKDLIIQLDLVSIVDREVACYSISSKNMVNVDLVRDWLIEQATLGAESNM
ncbi:ADP-ribosylation factor family protein [Spraguea lophii 42_110]|uniref:ADP-ribosylation factor family protein n=1 Tax=Spraguea lophii (strain 42_110) TaxID=1358809 RepID=S7WAU2_SPRLO|nr:ADP-ribosylation factor family protein [Spraguea lophii 42_110]